MMDQQSSTVYSFYLQKSISGTDFVKNEGIFVCQSYSLKYSIEETRKSFLIFAIKKAPTKHKSVLLIRISI